MKTTIISTYTKLIALVLVFALLVPMLTSLPFKGIALDAESENVDSASPPEQNHVAAGNEDDTGIAEATVAISFEESLPEETAGGITEILSLREENVKHFAMTDGTYRAVSYGNAVHRKDASGNWQDIDNNLHLTAVKGIEHYASAEGRIAFAKSYVANAPLFALNENGYTVAMALASEPPSLGELTPIAPIISPNEQTVTIVGHALRSANNTYQTAEEAATIDNTSKIRYANVRNGIDLEYVLVGNDVKENIIVKTRQNHYSYQFTLSLTGLEATLQTDGSITLADSESGDVQYVIPAPYMIDAAGEASDAVSYELSETADGVYTLTVSADAAWINASDRAFPVAIDPSINVNIGNDTYISSANPDTNYSSSNALLVSEGEIAFVYKAMPTLPAGATIDSAYLHMSYYFDSTVTIGLVQVGAYQLNHPRNFYEVTWNIAETYGNYGMALESLSTANAIVAPNTSSSSPRSLHLTVTDAVDSWYNGSPNYGIGLKYQSGTVSRVYFHVLTATASSHRPYYEINYTYYIPDGVYAFENVGNDNYWMTVWNDSVWPGDPMQQEYAATAPTDSFDRSSLFKITRVPNTNLYTIRSMLDNRMSFGVTETGVTLKDLILDDSSVDLSETFYITWETNGFQIRPYGSSKVITASTTATANLSTVESSASGATSRWSLVQYTGPVRYGGTCYMPVVRVAGTDITLTPRSWSTVAGAHQLYMYVHINSRHIMSGVGWDSVNDRLTVRVHQAGEAILYADISAEMPEHYLTFVISTSLPFAEGSYFIRNQAYGNFLQIDDAAAPNYTASGASLEVHTFDGGDEQRWNVTHIVDGYYKILSVKSGLAMSVQTDSLNSGGESIVQLAYTGADYQLWNIVKTSSGTYVLYPKSRTAATSSNWCASAVSSSSTSVQQSAYVSDNNYRDEWGIYALGEDAFFLGVPDAGHDHSSYFGKIMGYSVSLGYDTFDVLISNAATKSAVINKISDAEIYASRSHGGYDSNGTFIVLNSNQRLNSSDFYNFNTQTAMVDLSGCDIVLFAACYTAYGNQSLPQAAVNAGALHAIGFKDSIACSRANQFLEYFFESLAAGESVEEACEYAAELSQLGDSCEYFTSLEQ